MSVSPIGGSGYPVTAQEWAPTGQHAAAAQTTKAADADHDGDSDTPGRLDVKA